MNKKETPQHHPATTDEAGENSVHDLNDDNDFGKCIIFLDQPFREKKKNSHCGSDFPYTVTVSKVLRWLLPSMERLIQSTDEMSKSFLTRFLSSSSTKPTKNSSAVSG